jgi:hypothetical protein
VRHGLIAAGLLASCASPGAPPMSMLIIERRHLEGRERSMPERFRLFKVADQCVLVHERTGQRSLLVETRCAEAPAPVPK